MADFGLLLITFLKNFDLETPQFTLPKHYKEKTITQETKKQKL